MSGKRNGKRVKKWPELYQRDLSSLNNQELNEHINDIKDYRMMLGGTVRFSSTETIILLSQAISEINARSSARLAKVAIFVAIVSVLSSMVAICLQAFS